MTSFTVSLLLVTVLTQQTQGAPNDHQYAELLSTEYLDTVRHGVPMRELRSHDEHRQTGLLASEGDYLPIPNLSDCSPEDRVTYTAATLEYEPFSDWEAVGFNGEGILRENVLRISEFAADAKAQGADLLVAPEYGVQGLDMHLNDSVRFLSLTQTVPHPSLGAVPCLDPTDPGNYEAIRQLSCTARQLSMYLVVDLAEQAACDPASSNSSSCQDAGIDFHNTQVVFDRAGAVVARYRKQNLYLEPQFTPGPMDDSLAIFVTDFGVKFSLQICFDITFQHPGYNNIRDEGVRDIIMSTAWVDELPFIMAVNVQNGWSRGLGTNLVVSGYHWPERTKLGSGIYRGYSDLNNWYTYDPDSGDVLLVAPVHTCRQGLVTGPPPAVQLSTTEPIVTRYPAVNGAKSERQHNILHEDLSVYNRTVLPTTPAGESTTVTLCHEDGLCCRLEYEHSSSDQVYQLLAFSGVLKKGGGTYQIYSQVCAVVWCLNEDYHTCARLNLVQTPEDQFGPFILEGGDFISDAVYPVALTRQLTLTPNDKFLPSFNGSKHTMAAAAPLDSLVSVALFGRVYDRDP